MRRPSKPATLRQACSQELDAFEDQKMSRPIVVDADWDPEAAVWVATTQDLRGLVTEAETVEALRAKLPGMILDLLEENGVSDLPASIEIIAPVS
jgi:predicted RNase H-like HicB family nuclease